MAALIARMQTIEMPFYFSLALDNGVKPAELSEIVTHLAFYSGWASAMSAVAVAKDIFQQRGIGVDQLSPAKDEHLRLTVFPALERLKFYFPDAYDSLSGGDRKQKEAFEKDRLAAKS